MSPIPDDLAARLSAAEARLAAVERLLAQHPGDRVLEDEAYRLELEIRDCRIVQALHEFAVTWARLQMAERAPLN